MPTNYHRFIDTIVQEYDEIYVNIYNILQQKSLDSAIGQSLDNYGHFLDMPREYGEPDVDYGHRLLTYVLSIKDSTTKFSIKTFASNYLDVDESSIMVFEDNPAWVVIVVPQEYSDIEENLYKYLYKIVGAGVYVQIQFANTVWDVAKWDNDNYKWS